MLCTEKEASEKRCTPAAAVLWLLPTEARNGIAATGGASANCVGSRCMQWQWYDYVDPSGHTWRNSEVFRKGRATQTDGGYSQYPGRGFCGLTGTRE